MASLQFAFLAEYAKVESSATLTAIGAGIRGVGVSGESGEFDIFVAGSVDRDHGEGAVMLSITLEAPKGAYRLTQSGAMEQAPDTGEFVSTVFAFRLNVPVVGLGKYIVTLEMNDTEVHRLDLWVATAPSVPPAGD